MPIRFTLASLVAAALIAGPIVADAAVATTATTPAPKPVTPDVLRLTVATPSPAPTPLTGPPQNVSTPTLWIKPYAGNQMIFTNINESMSDNGKGCMTFTITAPLNANDAVTLLQDYNRQTPFDGVTIYAGPVVYALLGAKIKSYSASSTNARFTISALRTTTRAGSQETMSDCPVAGG